MWSTPGAYAIVSYVLFILINASIDVVTVADTHATSGVVYDCPSRREMVHYPQEENPFVKILLTQNEYRLESNILLLRQKINLL